MDFQNLNKKFNLCIYIVIFFSIFFFLIGFFFQENSAGAGGFKGDFQNVWNNLSIFKNNDFKEGLKATAGIGEIKYASSRTPLIYILNAYLNPFAGSKNVYILSIFFFSIFIFFLFYLSLKKNIKMSIKVLILYFYHALSCSALILELVLIGV